MHDKLNIYFSFLKSFEYIVITLPNKISNQMFSFVHFLNPYYLSQTYDLQETIILYQIFYS